MIPLFISLGKCSFLCSTLNVDFKIRVFQHFVELKWNDSKDICDKFNRGSCSTDWIVLSPRFESNKLKVHMMHHVEEVLIIMFLLKTNFWAFLFIMINMNVHRQGIPQSADRRRCVPPRFYIPDLWLIITTWGIPLNIMHEVNRARQTCPVWVYNFASQVRRDSEMSMASVEPDQGESPC